MLQTQIMKALFFPNSYVRNLKSLFTYPFSSCNGKFKEVLIKELFLLLSEFHVLQYGTYYSLCYFSSQ